MNKNLYEIKIFPLFGLIYFCFLFMICLGVLFIADKNMPDYLAWKEYSSSRFQDIKNKRTFLYDTDYPMLNYPLTKYSSNTKRIVILGDSYLEGNGIGNINDTWWKKLQIELYNRGYYDVEIIAVAKSGASTYDEYIWLMETNLLNDIQPDLIIFGFVKNDLELELICNNAIEKDFIYNNQFTNFLSKIYPNFFYKFNNRLEQKYSKIKEFNNEEEYTHGKCLDVILSDEHINKYNEKVVRPLDEFLQQKKFPTLLFTTTSTNENYLNVLSLFENTCIKTYNMYDQFLEEKTHNKKLVKTYEEANPADGHPGAYLSTFLASYYADILEKDYTIYLGEKYDEKKEYPLVINDIFPVELNVKRINETEKYVEYFLHGVEEEQMLYMPIKKKYVKLNLEFPIEIEKIEISGSHDVYITKIDEKLGFDTQKMYKLKGKNSYQVEESILVTTINITNVKEDTTIRIYKR